MREPCRTRNCIEEDTFEKGKQSIAKSVKRLDEILDGITWVMANAPDSFLNIPGTNLWLAKTDPALDAPAIWVWFTFDDGAVHLQLIEKAPSN